MTGGSLLIGAMVLGVLATNWKAPDGMVLRADVSMIALFDGIRPTTGETPVLSASAETASPTTLGTCYTSVLVAFRPR